MKSHRVVSSFSESPTCLDLPHRPHLVDTLRQLVPDVLHKAEEKNENNREIFREVKIKPGKLDVGRVNGSGNVGDVIFNGKRSRQSALGEVAEVEAGVDGKDLGGERFGVFQITNFKLQGAYKPGLGEGCRRWD